MRAAVLKTRALLRALERRIRRHLFAEDEIGLRLERAFAELANEIRSERSEVCVSRRAPGSRTG